MVAHPVCNWCVVGAMRCVSKRCMTKIAYMYAMMSINKRCTKKIVYVYMMMHIGYRQTAKIVDANAMN